MRWHENGQKSYEATYKDGKQDGLRTRWHENGQKKAEINFKNGNPVEGSEKYWNSKGERVDSIEEAITE
jgi:antitoxin component YwqK of YwqJK toxin-antitoxin module